MTGSGRSRDEKTRREQRGWYFYDWANSAFSTTVVTVFLGPYLTDVADNASDAGGLVYPLGIPVLAGSYFPYILSLSVVLQVFLLPITGAIADRTRKKKRLLMLFAYIGALSTMALYLVQGSAYLVGGLLFVVANLVLFSAHDSLGLSAGQAVRVSLLSAGAWWALFALIPLATLRDRGSGRSDAKGAAVAAAGFRQLLGTLRAARAYPQTLLFLGAYLLFNDGIQTVITLTAVYAKAELNLGTGTIISAVLMVQFLAFIGALLLGACARYFGAKRVVLASLILWTGAVAGAYLLQAGAVWQFYLLGAL